MPDRSQSDEPTATLIVSMRYAHRRGGVGMSTYLTLDGATLDLGILTPEERAYFDLSLIHI